jgi:hypothetical protein
MRRIPLLTTALVGAVLLVTMTPAAATSNAARVVRFKTDSAGESYPLCESRSSLCTDMYTSPGDEYVGHDEPSLEFKSNVTGSGNDVTYTMTLPTDPKARPGQNGTGGTWNFQLRPTFWFGMTMCDTQSAPEFTHTCTPDSNSNNLTGTNPSSANYIGKHPGNAYMELQFYGPGYVPQFEGFGCAAHMYCAAMTIDSRTLDQNTGIENTSACNDYILGGPEPINWAYVTHDGVSQAPANPLFTGTFTSPNFAAVNPDYSKDLLMRPGDTIQIHMFDTPAGFRTELTDLTTGQSGSMTASVSNGFGHIMYTPNSNTCTEQPYAFHPEYSTANTRGNTWSAHTYNVAMSDEIGHFENCVKLNVEYNCAVATGPDRSTGLDPDDDQNFCVPGRDSTLVKINGCFFNDGDWDGPSYQRDWSGTNPNVAIDQHLHPSPLLFTSPLANGHTQFSTISFETDLPRIEASDAQFNPPFCDRTTGAHCVDPPMGADFYPFFSTRMNRGTCTWQEGGDFIPGTLNDYGGSAHAEFGPLLQTVYPVKGWTTETLYNNFNSGNLSNDCPVR